VAWLSNLKYKNYFITSVTSAFRWGHLGDKKEVFGDAPEAVN